MSSFDVDAAASYARSEARTSSTGRCATHVRLAIEAGGVELERQVSAKNYGTSLSRAGFTRLAQPPQSSPQKGDVIVIQPYPGGSDHGHIAIYDGSAWISDFVQRDKWGGAGYRQHEPAYEIYRHSSQETPGATHE